MKQQKIIDIRLFPVLIGLNIKIQTMLLRKQSYEKVHNGKKCIYISITPFCKIKFTFDFVRNFGWGSSCPRSVGHDKYVGAGLVPARDRVTTRVTPTSFYFSSLSNSHYFLLSSKKFINISFRCLFDELFSIMFTFLSHV